MLSNKNFHAELPARETSSGKGTEAESQHVEAEGTMISRGLTRRNLEAKMPAGAPGQLSKTQQVLESFSLESR